MSDEEMATEREAVKRERAAYVRGVGEGRQFWADKSNAECRAEMFYPLPKRQRPLRVTLSNQAAWSYDGNRWVRHFPNGCEDTTGAPDLSCASVTDLSALLRCRSGELEDVPEGENA